MATSDTQLNLGSLSYKDDSNEDTQSQLNLHEAKQLLVESDTIYFANTDDPDNFDYPDELSPIDFPCGSDPVAFKDAIQVLPDAVRGELQSVNDFVNPDGSINIDQIKETDGISIADLPVNISTISKDSRTDSITDNVTIKDPRRELLAALGADIKYHWQIASDSYAIINPQAAYWPAYKTFVQKGERDSIFGCIKYGDYGGEVDLYIFFKDHTIPRPTADGEDSNNDPPIYIGLHSSYDFKGGRRLGLQLFGYDPKNKTRLYRIDGSNRRGRKHVGDPHNKSHERENDRLPIDEWWEKEYENNKTLTDELIDDIETATATTLQFETDDIPFTLKEFYDFLDIPESYIIQTDEGVGAVTRAKRLSPDGETHTMWSLYMALATTLEKEFQGENRTGYQFRVHADTATEIFRKPLQLIARAKREYEIENENKDPNEANSEFTEESVQKLDGVCTEDQLDLTKKRQITENLQNSLFDFDSD